MAKHNGKTQSQMFLLRYGRHVGAPQNGWITGPYRLSVTSRLLFLQITMRAARVRNDRWIRVGLAVIAPKIQWIDQ